MPTIQLPRPIDAPGPEAPFVARLDLAELALLVARAGSPTLPVDLDPAATDTPEQVRLHARLDDGSTSRTQRARALLRAALDRAEDDPGSVVPRLSDLGLLDAHGTPTREVVAALRALGAPEALLVLDLAVTREGDEARLRSWFAVTGTEVTQLSTATGLTWELASYDVSLLPTALARAATVEERDTDDAGAQVDLADRVEVPFELFADGTEAVRRRREDLLAELVRLAPAPVLVDGAPVAPHAAAEVVTALETATRGRLRVLVAAGSGSGTVGVLTWLRTGDVWRSLTPVVRDHVPTLVVEGTEARTLARHVAPLLARVAGGGPR